jgi:hypothetical protein
MSRLFIELYLDEDVHVLVADEFKIVTIKKIIDFRSCAIAFQKTLLIISLIT